MVIKSKTSFSDRVRAVVSRIPRGKTLTYVQVATKAGNPKAARAVGTILRKNTNKNIPCYRVVRSDGTPGNYNGLIGGTSGPAAKLKLIQKDLK